MLLFLGIGRVGRLVDVDGDRWGRSMALRNRLRWRIGEQRCRGIRVLDDWGTGTRSIDGGPSAMDYGVL